MPHDFSHNYATRYRRDYGGETAPAARRVLGAWKTGHKTLRTLVMLTKACGFRLVASLTRPSAATDVGHDSIVPRPTGYSSFFSLSLKTRLNFVIFGRITARQYDCLGFRS